MILPALRDDPHGAFGNMAGLQNRVAILGQLLDALMADLEDADDPACSGKTLAENTVITIHGDTPKTPLNRNGWPDGTPDGSNWIYAYGAGYLKTGWFGGINADGSVAGFDPTTGETVPNQLSTVTTASANAAVAYAVARGDMTRVSEFYNGPSIAGVVNEVLQ